MSIIRKLIGILKIFKEYNSVFNVKQSLTFILFELLKKEITKIIKVKNEQLHIRTNSPDIKVAIRTLYRSEFDTIDCNNPLVIVDVGAYIGTSAIFFAKKYPNAKIFAIEPEDQNFSLLQKNIKNFENIIPIQAAIWNANEIRTIQNRFTGHWGYTISETFNRIESTGQDITCITLPYLMKKYNLNSIDILKMDIEGSEKSVLEKSDDWIEKVQIITVELHDRIVMGCERAFYLATQNFTKFERNGEKITAYR